MVQLLTLGKFLGWGKKGERHRKSPILVYSCRRNTSVGLMVRQESRYVPGVVLRKHARLVRNEGQGQRESVAFRNHDRRALFNK